MPANDDDTHVAEDLLDMLKLFLLSVNVLLFVAAAVVFATSPKRPASDATATAGDGAVPAVKHALLVTAHPDDESMFFLPLLHSLAQQSNGTPDWEVHLLCLSRGNFDGLGDIREQEMVTCGEFLGMKKANIRVLEDAKLQDGMQAQWDHAHIAQLVLAYIETHAIKAVFTFDDYGVSGHANHIAVHYGVKQAIAEQHRRCAASTATKPMTAVRGWALESTNIVRKYIGVCDAIVSSWATNRASPSNGAAAADSTASDAAFVFLFKPWWNYHAMALHHSQFVWYRRLFVVFSRYTFVNTFQPMVHSSSTATESPSPSAGETKKTQ